MKSLLRAGCRTVAAGSSRSARFNSTAGDEGVPPPPQQQQQQQQDPFASLFPGLNKLSPDRLKVAAGHLHLIVEDGWEGDSFTWNFAENLSDSVFPAAGHQWHLDFDIKREPSVDLQANEITGATFRIYTLKRLTRGHPIPIRVQTVLKDSEGGEKSAERFFYTPLQAQSPSMIEEKFEILRLSELDEEFIKETIDVDKLASLTVKVQLCPQLVPELVDALYNEAEKAAADNKQQ
eukprot:Rhum_TRINITY_DN8670_c0_g1::Rhum_TRINITY_DN8670_c0_g1_i1::g.29256::m.29256